MPRTTKPPSALVLATTGLVLLVLGLPLSCSRPPTPGRIVASASPRVVAQPPDIPSALASAQPPDADADADAAPPTPATFPWLKAAQALPVRIARPESATCLSSLDVDDNLDDWRAAMEAGSPKRITVLAYARYGMGCPCYEWYSFAGGSLLPFFVDGLPTEGVAPPRVHGGAFTLTGYFTGRQINTYEWYAAHGSPDATPEEGGDYDERHLEFVVEGWCFHPPKPDPGWNKLYRESNTAMRKLGMPFCKAENPCLDWPKVLPTGECTRELVSKKAHLLNDRDMLPEWDAAAARYRNVSPGEPQRQPCASVSIQTWHDAGARGISERHGAKTFERVGDIPEIAEIALGLTPPWTLHFETPDRAIDAMRGLLCDPEVASASICSAAK